MTKQKQDGEPVDADAEPTAELEMLPASALDPTDSHRIFDSADGDELIAAAGSYINDANDANDVLGVDSGESPLNDALDVLRGEVNGVRALTETLDLDIQDCQSVTTMLAKDLEAMRMKQTATEELLGLCRSEIEKLKAQMAMGEHDLAPPDGPPGPGAQRSQQVPPQTMPGSDQQVEFGMLPKAETVEPPFIEEPSNVNRAQVVPISAVNDSSAKRVRERLLVLRNCSTSKSFALDDGNVRLGSSPDNDIRLGSSYVSRHHAEFVSSVAGCVLKDLDSTNGTYVNSRRVRRCALRNGDWIAIGKHRFEFVEQQ